MYAYIYIYIEREREICWFTCMHIYVYMYVYIVIYTRTSLSFSALSGVSPLLPSCAEPMMGAPQVMPVTWCLRCAYRCTAVYRSSGMIMIRRRIMIMCIYIYIYMCNDGNSNSNNKKTNSCPLNHNTCPLAFGIRFGKQRAPIQPTFLSEVL